MSYIESSAELSFAQGLGINLFQGKYIHNLLNESLTKLAYKKSL
jgi:EAL domain-containing protein (putative c-di-GMP-specific phosphodiesterase class I)